MSRGKMISAFAAMLLLFSACSSTVFDGLGGPTATSTSAATTRPAATTAAPAKQDITLVENAFGRTASGSYWWYALIIENPNRDYVFSSEAIRVEAISGSGVILDSDIKYATLLSGRTVLVGSFFNVGNEEIAELNVRGPLANSAIKAPYAETGAFVITDIEVETNRFSTTVSGIVSSTFAAEQSFVEVVVIARNESGLIIATDRTYVDRVPVDGRVRFEASFFETLPGGTTYEAFALA